MLFSCSGVQWSTEFKILKHEIDLMLKIEADQMIAKDKITLIAATSNAKIDLFLNKTLKVDSLIIEGKLCEFKIKNSINLRKKKRSLLKSSQFLSNQAQMIQTTIPEELEVDTLRLEVFYHGTLMDISHKKGSGNEVVSTILFDPEKCWYPNHFRGLVKFRLAVEAPVDYEVISQGTLITRKSIRYNQLLTIWEAERPSPALSVTVGPYVFTPFTYQNINLYTYLYKSHAYLSARLLEAASRYVALYSQLIGEYPYTKLAITENPFGKMISGPSFCSIDSSKISHTILFETILGHQICRNWWGNGVFNWPDSSDWTEGLALYYAEHYFKEQVGDKAAGEYRLVINREYLKKINHENDFILSDASDMVNVPIHIRNGKAMMVFHQICQAMGETDFRMALRQFYQTFYFKYASWNDLKNSFEKVWKKDLDGLFHQWLYQKGAPQFSIKQANFQRKSRQYVVKATISCQTFSKESLDNSFPYKINLPIVLETRSGDVRKYFQTDSSTILVQFTTTAKPIKLQIDPYHEVFRRLSPQARYLHLSQVLNDPDKIFVLPGKIASESLKAYRRQIGYFKSPDDNPPIEFDRKLEKADIQNHSLILFGGIKENYLTQRFYQSMPSDIRIVHDCFIYQNHKYWKQDHAIVAVMPNPLNNEKQIILFWGISPDAILASATEVQDYGNYAFILYHKGSKKSWGQWSLDSGPTIHSFRDRKSSKRSR